MPEKNCVSDRLLGVLRQEPLSDYKAARVEAVEKKYGRTAGEADFADGVFENAESKKYFAD